MAKHVLWARPVGPIDRKPIAQTFHISSLTQFVSIVLGQSGEVQLHVDNKQF